MLIQYFFKNMAKSEETVLRDYFESKIKAIEKTIARFPEDAVSLEIKSEKFDKHSAFNVELVMKSPTGNFSAKETSHTLKKAIDLAKDRLTMQLRKTTSKLRRTHRGLRMKNAVRTKTQTVQI